MKKTTSLSVFTRSLNRDGAEGSSTQPELNEQRVQSQTCLNYAESRVKSSKTQCPSRK